MARNLVDKPIPKQFTFPGGYRVSIIETNRPSKFLDADSDAEYHEPIRQIAIWIGLTPGQKWRRLYHELGHAWLDAQRWACNETGVN